MEIIYKKKGILIEDLDTWKRLGHPKSGDQWKVGRSSYEMASLAINRKDEFISIIKSLLIECGLDEQDFVCEPEAIVSLGNGTGPGSRNHDLLMIGSDVVIGIEAKVSEPFGNSSIYEESKLQTWHNRNGQTRADLLVDFLTPNADSSDIGYQLFTATKGTLNAAEKSNYKCCIQAVLVFVGNVCKEEDYAKRIEKNNKDFSHFLKATKADKSGLIMRNGISCYLKKVETRVP